MDKAILTFYKGDLVVFKKDTIIGSRKIPRGAVVEGKVESVYANGFNVDVIITKIEQEVVDEPHRLDTSLIGKTYRGSPEDYELKNNDETIFRIPVKYRGEMEISVRASSLAEAFHKVHNFKFNIPQSDHKENILEIDFHKYEKTEEYKEQSKKERIYQSRRELYIGKTNFATVDSSEGFTNVEQIRGYFYENEGIYFLHEYHMNDEEEYEIIYHYHGDDSDFKEIKVVIDQNMKFIVEDVE